MTTKQVATRLVDLCRQGKIMEVQKELYGETIESVEPDHGRVKSAKGLKAVTEKGIQFASMIDERHGGEISDPIIFGKHFSIGWSMDVTMKGAGRVNLEEICVYEVNDGKIVREQFYF
jgi:hypothetical protein